MTFKFGSVILQSAKLHSLFCIVPLKTLIKVSTLSLLTLTGFKAQCSLLPTSFGLIDKEFGYNLEFGIQICLHLFPWYTKSVALGFNVEERVIKVSWECFGTNILLRSLFSCGVELHVSYVLTTLARDSVFTVLILSHIGHNIHCQPA